MLFIPIKVQVITIKWLPNKCPSRELGLNKFAQKIHYASFLLFFFNILCQSYKT